MLAYAGVKPSQIIGEFLPGGGYYTRLLSDIVGPHGKIYALETMRWGKEAIDATRQVLHEKGHGNVDMDLALFGNFHLPEQIDLFWTTLNYHDLHIARYGNVDIAAFNRHVFDSLKHGGIYFIVDHAATKGSGIRDTPDLHRIDETTVIEEVKAAGLFWPAKAICCAIQPTTTPRRCSILRSGGRPTSSSSSSESPNTARATSRMGAAMGDR